MQTYQTLTAAEAATMTTYRITRPDHTGNPTRSEYPGEAALHLDAATAGVSLTGHVTRDEATIAASAIEAVSESPYACVVTEQRD